MDDTLPVFEPVEDLPVLSSSEARYLLFGPVDPDIERAEQACRSGDVHQATLCIGRLRQTGTPVESLQTCLLGAVETESHGLVRMLLSAGVPITSLVIEPTLRQNSRPILSMFVEHGWDINEEEAWCIPPWLSYVPAAQQHLQVC